MSQLSSGTASSYMAFQPRQRFAPLLHSPGLPVHVHGRAPTCPFRPHFSAARKPHSAPPLTIIAIAAVRESGSAETRRFRSLCSSYLSEIGAETPPRTRTGEHWEVGGGGRDNCRCRRRPSPPEEDSRVRPVRRSAVDAIDGDETEKGTCASPRKQNTHLEGRGRGRGGTLFF